MKLQREVPDNELWGFLLLDERALPLHRSTLMSCLWQIHGFSYMTRGIFLAISAKLIVRSVLGLGRGSYRSLPGGED